MSASSSGGLLVNESSGCSIVPRTWTNVSTPEDDAPRGQIEQRIDDVAPLEADAPVAQDVEPPSLEAVAAADGVHLAGQAKLPARRLLDLSIAPPT